MVFWDGDNGALWCLMVLDGACKCYECAGGLDFLLLEDQFVVLLVLQHTIPFAPDFTCWVCTKHSNSVNVFSPFASEAPAWVKRLLQMSVTIQTVQSFKKG